jgi:hypothetical protein
MGVAWQQAVLGNHSLGKLVLIADADEFLVHDSFEDRSIQHFVGQIEGDGSSAVRVFMIDMYPFGDLSEADFAQQTPFAAASWFDKDPCRPWNLTRGSFGNAQSYVSALRHRLDTHAQPNAYTAQKIALFKYYPWVRLSAGVHDAANLKISPNPAAFAHFKYHAGFAAKANAEARRGQHFNNAYEYRRYAAMCAKGSSQFSESGVSTKYADSKSFAFLGKDGRA